MSEDKKPLCESCGDPDERVVGKCCYCGEPFCANCGSTNKGDCDRCNEARHYDGCACVDREGPCTDFEAFARKLEAIHEEWRKDPTPTRIAVSNLTDSLVAQCRKLDAMIAELKAKLEEADKQRTPLPPAAEEGAKQEEDAGR